MTKCLYTVDVSSYVDGDALDVHKISKGVVEKLQALLPDVFPHHLSLLFAKIANDPKSTADDFDDAMEQLYEWGDQHKILIKTYV